MDYNWDKFQKFYDEGHSTRELMKEFGLHSAILKYGRQNGHLVFRSKSEAGKIHVKYHGPLRESSDITKSYNWEEMQKFYDEGHTWSEVVEQFECNNSIMSKAINMNLFKTRSQSEALKVRHEKYGTWKHTPESKRKLSEKRTSYLKEHPDQVPYKLNHYTKKTSYPETYFKEVFEKEQIDLKHHKQVGLFEIDFYNEELGIAIEIDGEQHYVDPRIVESDKRKNLFLSERGWTVYRIRWAKYQKLNFEEKHQVVERIKSLLIKKERDGKIVIPLTEDATSLLDG